MVIAQSNKKTKRSYRVFLKSGTAFTILFICSLANSCKKQENSLPSPKTCDCPIENDCFDFEPVPPDMVVIGLRNTLDSIQNEKPSFNPNNANEIVYVKNSFSYQELVVTNIATKEKRTIYKGKVYSQPHWGINGWIVFSDNQVWKIRSDGTGLEQLTFSDNNFYPTWSFDAKRIAFHKVIDTVINGRNVGYGVGAIFNEDSGEIERVEDTTIGFYSNTAWNVNNLINLHPRNKGLYLYNPDTKEKQKVANWEFCSKINSHASGVCWAGANTLIWSHDEGLFKLDIQTGKNTCIAKNCDSRKYYFPSYSATSNKLVVQCVVSKKPVNYKTTYNTLLCIMDVDGSNKRFID